MFAFAKAGIPLGIMLGLVVGKLLGGAALCGIGFTMSIFIGALAFEHVAGDAAGYILTHRLGILSGSIIAGLLGYLIIRTAPAGQVVTATVPASEKEKEVAEVGEEPQQSPFG